MQVRVVPMIHSGPDEDGTLSASPLRGPGKFLGELDYRVAPDAREPFLPSGGIGALRIVIIDRVTAGKRSRNSKLSEQKVVDRGNRNPTARGLKIFHGYAAMIGSLIAKIGKSDRNFAIANILQRQ